jgi:putative PEP-CTERM system TPR-repeat lipoprotein
MTIAALCAKGLFITSLAFSLAACFGPGPEKLLATAQQHLDRGDPVAAAIEAKNLLKDHPDSGPGRLLLGRALLASGDLAGAELELGRAQSAGVPDVDLAPQLATLWLRQGKPQQVVSRYAELVLPASQQQAALRTLVAQALGELGQTADAERQLAAALTAVPGFAPALTAQARSLAASGDTPAARRMVSELLQRQADHAPAWVLQGDLLAQSAEDSARAIDAYRKALALNSRLAEAHGGIVTVLLLQSNAAGAQAQAAAMAKALPGNPATLYFQALVAYQRGDLARAREVLDVLARGTNGNAQVLLLAGMTHLGLGQLEQAEVLLARSAVLAPKSSQPRQELARLHLKRGQPARALEQLAPLLEEPAADAQALSIASLAYARLGDFKAADAAVARAKALQPADAGIRMAAATMQIDRGQAEAGLRSLQGAADAQTEALDADLVLVAAHMRRNDRATALLALDKAAAKQPKQPLVDFLRGKVHEQGGDLAAARQAYEKALTKDASYRQALESLAVLDLVQLDFASARKRFEPVVKKDPKAAWAVLALADVGLRAGDRPAAVSALIDKSVQTDPLDASNWLAALHLQRSLGDRSATLARAQAAQAALPNDPRILLQLVAAQAAQGEYQQAIGNLNRLQQLQPQSAPVHLQLALVQGAAGNLAAARTALDNALRLSPTAPDVVRAAMALALQDKQPERAVQLAREVQSRLPAQATGWLLEGDFELQRGQAPAAVAAYRAALAKQESPQTAARLHRALLALDPSQAQQFSARRLQEHPKDGYFLVYLAEQAQAAAKWPEAEARYKQALQIAPEDAMVQNNLANVLLAQGKRPEALSLAQRAARQAPHMPEVLDTLAAAHAQSGQWSQAVEVQQRALEMQPQDDGYRLRLAHILVGAGSKDKAREELAKLMRPGASASIRADAEKLLREIGA